MSILSRLATELFNLPPSPRLLRRELDEMRAALDLVDPVIPWSLEELELLSIKYRPLKTRKLPMDKAGYIDNIYHEPVLLYGLKQYRRRQDYAILIIRHGSTEYVYLRSPKVVRVYRQGHGLGSIDDQGHLRTSRRRGPSYRILSGSGAYDTILEDKKSIAQLAAPSRADRNNPRAIVLLEDLTDENRAYVEALSFYELSQNLIIS